MAFLLWGSVARPSSATQARLASHPRARFPSPRRDIDAMLDYSFKVIEHDPKRPWIGVSSERETTRTGQMTEAVAGVRRAFRASGDSATRRLEVLRRRQSPYRLDASALRDERPAPLLSRPLSRGSGSSGVRLPMRRRTLRLTLFTPGSPVKREPRIANVRMASRHDVDPVDAFRLIPHARFDAAYQ